MIKACAICIKTAVSFLIENGPFLPLGKYFSLDKIHFK